MAMCLLKMMISSMMTIMKMIMKTTSQKEVCSVDGPKDMTMRKRMNLMI